MLADGEAHCVHCWRARFELTMRPMATGHEQTWEEEVDYSAGGWMMVEDFSTHDNLDSPLLAREEYSEVWPFANELVDELCASVYVLVGACHEMRGGGACGLGHVPQRGRARGARDMGPIAKRPTGRPSRKWIRRPTCVD